MTAEELRGSSRPSAATVDDSSTGIRPGTAEITELFRQHHLELVRLAALLVRSREAGEDIVQDVFIKIHARPAGPPDPAGGLRACAKPWSMAADRGSAAKRWPEDSVLRTGRRLTSRSQPNIR